MALIYVQKLSSGPRCKEQRGSMAIIRELSVQRRGKEQDGWRAMVGEICSHCGEMAVGG